MKYIKNLILIGAFLFSNPLFCLDVKTVSHDLPPMMRLVGQVVDVSSDLIPDKYKEHQERTKAAAEFISLSAAIVQNGVNFSDHLPVIEQKVDLLQKRIACLNKPGLPTCSDSTLDCTQEHLCIAKTLETLSEILDPLIGDVLGKIKLNEDGQPLKKDGKLQIEQGALLNLVAILPTGNPKDKKKKEEYAKQLIDFTVSASEVLDFIRILMYSIDPALLEGNTTLTAAQRKIYEEEPLRIEEEELEHESGGEPSVSEKHA